MWLYLQVARLLGLNEAAILPKRAIQVCISVHNSLSSGCFSDPSVILFLAQNLCMLQATPSYRSGLCWWSSYIFPYSSFSLVLGLQGNQIDKTLEVIVQQTKHQQEVQWYTGRQTRNIATWLWNCMCRSGVLRAHFLKFHKLVLRQTEVDWLWKCLQKDIMPSFRSSLLKNIISLILPMNA